MYNVHKQRKINHHHHHNIGIIENNDNDDTDSTTTTTTTTTTIDFSIPIFSDLLSVIFEYLLFIDMNIIRLVSKTFLNVISKNTIFYDSLVLVEHEYLKKYEKFPEFITGVILNKNFIKSVMVEWCREMYVDGVNNMKNRKTMKKFFKRYFFFFGDINGNGNNKDDNKGKKLKMIRNCGFKDYCVCSGDYENEKTMNDEWKMVCEMVMKYKISLKMISWVKSCKFCVNKIIGNEKFPILENLRTIKLIFEKNIKFCDVMEVNINEKVMKNLENFIIDWLFISEQCFDKFKTFKNVRFISLYLTFDENISKKNFEKFLLLMKTNNNKLLWCTRLRHKFSKLIGLFSIIQRYKFKMNWFYE